ncbi:diguanylate cyclase [Bacillus sp. FJAT-27245]|uniref:diguanylate cyclase n=1 Tax=Bacillus sp. FJAT-27245 TaxID=1684144 RepID=UPI0006A78AD2|nr:diguanylate cyclase [Bacillus sp. FJAT-27245]
MGMEKFEKMLLDKIKNQLSDWFDVQGANMPSDAELFRFLHSIKGTAGSVGFIAFTELAENLMVQLDEDGSRQWKQNDLKNFMHGLISLTYEYENDSRIKNIDANLPVIQIISEDISGIVLVKDALEENGWIVMPYTTPEKVFRSNYDFKPDLIIVDSRRTFGTGILEDFERHYGNSFIPVLVIGNVSSWKERAEAYKRGADDFVEIPFEMEELIARAGRLLKRKELFNQIALLDELTGLYNRRFLKDIFKRNIASLSRTNKVFCLAILDIDHFKEINDEFGHLTGDRVLSFIASQIKERTRGTDSSFRFGGEEFAIILPGTGIQEAEAILNRLLNEIRNHVFSENGKSFSVTFSAGIYLVNNDQVTLEDAIGGADRCLYMAKENGRSQVATKCGGGGEPFTKKLHVSIIDDDAIIRSMLSKIIRGMEVPGVHIHVEAFENGRLFFDSNQLTLEGEHFLILDGVMPVMDGLEVLQKVRKESEGTSVKILMLTARKNEYDIARALKLGADDYVTKPFSLTELEARIKVLIQRPNNGS